MNATSIATKTVRMFANFDKNLFIPLTGEMEKIDSLYEKLKAHGAALSRHTIAALIEGSEKIIRGYEVVTVPDHHVEIAPAKKPDTKDMMNKVRGIISYVPAGQVAAVRKGSKIAIGLESLKNGCTVEELRDALGHDASESVQAFLAYRPKKRGYGIRFDAESKKYHLVMKEGQSEILYK